MNTPFAWRAMSTRLGWRAMSTRLAWRNVTHKKIRSIVVLCGITLAILLIFMQLGFRGAAEKSATSTYDALDFDIVVVSPNYAFIAEPGQLPRSRLEEMRAIDGVASVTPLWVTVGEWRNSQTRERWNVLTLGVDPGYPPFRDRSIDDQVAQLTVPDTALSDVVARPEVAPVTTGTRSELEGHRITIVGQYKIGVVFVAGGSLVMGRETYLSVFRNSAARDGISMGLVKVAPGASPEAVAAKMNAQLAPVAIALTRDQLGTRERHFWLNVKPVGIMFTSGVLVAFVVGSMIQYQVLASEVQNHLKEYATLKALGYGDRSIYGIILKQGLFFSNLGFILAFPLALLIYHLLSTQALVPVTMGLERVVGVLLLTGAMCLSATFLAIWKLRRADPADLF